VKEESNWCEKGVEGAYRVELLNRNQRMEEQREKRERDESTKFVFPNQNTQNLNLVFFFLIKITFLNTVNVT